MGPEEIVIRRSDLYPVGTVVRAYALPHPEAGLPLSGAPVGAVVSEATVAGTGTLTLTGLPEGVYYIAYARVGSEDRYLRFRIPSAIEDNPGGGATVAELVTEKERAEGAEGLKIPLTQRGAAEGVGTLDGTGRQPIAQSPLSVVNRRAGDALTQGFDNFTGKGTQALGSADSGQKYELVTSGTGATLSIIGGLATNTAALGKTAGYAALPSPGEPVLRMAADAAFSPGSYGFTAKTAKSNTLTEVSSFTGLAVGQVLSGAGIPAATTITELKAGENKIVMSAEATVEASGVAVTATATTGGIGLLIAWNEPFALPVAASTDCHVAIGPEGWQWGIWRPGGVFTLLSPAAGGNNPWASSFTWPTYPNTAHFEVYVFPGLGVLLGPDGVAYSVSDPRIGEYPGYYPMIEVYENEARSDRKASFARWSFDTARTIDVEGKQNQPSYTDLAHYLGKSLQHAAGEGTNVKLGGEALLKSTGEQNVALGFRAATATTTGKANISLGYLSMFSNTTGSENIAIGWQSLYNSTTANNNIAIGYEALHANTTGTPNIAIGQKALYANTEGKANIAIGKEALSANTTGEQNVAVGHLAGAAITTGVNNVAIGGEALHANTTANANTAVGFRALYTNTAAANTAVGREALKANTTGVSNVAVGSAALTTNTTGEKNTALGSEAGKENVSGTGNLFVGYQAGLKETGSNKLYVANSNTTEPLILGTFPNASLQFNATEMAFFKHALGKQGKVTGKKSTETEKVLTTLLAALSGVGLVLDETT